MGLSLVQAVIQLHGADIQLQDNAPGLRVHLQFERTADPEAAPDLGAR
ncbi:hypothetical protein [Candidatus Thiodictyon syntrophicum]